MTGDEGRESVAGGTQQPGDAGTAGDAGTTVPAGVARIRDLVNTREMSDGVVDEGWTSPADLVAWLSAHGLARPDVRLGDVELALAIRVREAIRDLLEGNAGHPVDPVSIAILDEAAAAAPVAVRFRNDGGTALAPGATGLQGALGQVFADIATAVADGSWARLKACRNDECRWAYYDASRNRSGRWCSMASCGNRMKGRAYRSRTRSVTAR